MTEQYMRIIDPAKEDTVVVPAQAAPFAIVGTHFTSRVDLGSFGILQFDSMLIRIDATGTLRRQITAALNADPALAASIQQAAFCPSGKP